MSFSYEAEADVVVKALDNVSFHARQGEVTAIVGPSGGGKSTIANLISRFWDVTEGNIQIGGVDIREIPLAEDVYKRQALTRGLDNPADRSSITRVGFTCYDAIAVVISGVMLFVTLFIIKW